MEKLICIISFLFFLSGYAQSQNPDSLDIDKAAYKIITAGLKPDFLAVDGDAVWVVDDHQNRIIKIGLFAVTPLLKITIPEACTAPVVGFNALWVMSCSEKILYKIDHQTGKVLAKIATGMADEKGEMSIAIAAGSVWLLADSAGLLIRVNPKTNNIKTRIKVLPDSYCVVAGRQVVWVSNYRNNSVQKIDTKTNKILSTIAVGLNPRFITAAGKWVYTLNQGDGTITKIDAISNKVVATINVNAKGPGGDINEDGKRVWVKSTNTEVPLQTINVATNKIEKIYKQNFKNGEAFKVDGAVRVTKKYVWVSGYYNKTIWILKNSMRNFNTN